MKAIVVHEFGGPEVLKLEDIPDPKPGPGQVLADRRVVERERGRDHGPRNEQGNDRRGQGFESEGSSGAARSMHQFIRPMNFTRHAKRRLRHVSM